MTGIFEVIAADDSQKRLSGRKAIVLANMRTQERFSKFLFEASTWDEYIARWELIKDDFDSTVTSACTEVGYDNRDSIAQTIANKFYAEGTERYNTTRHASVRESRKPKLCPYHKEVVDIALNSQDPAAGYNAMSSHWGGPRHCEGDGYEGGNCNFKPQMTTQSYWDEKAEKAEERKQEREDQRLQEEQTQLEEAPTEEISEPVAEEPAEDFVDGLAEFDTLDGEAPAEESVPEVPMAMAASFQGVEAEDKIKQGSTEKTAILDWLLNRKQDQRPPYRGQYGRGIDPAAYANMMLNLKIEEFVKQGMDPEAARQAAMKSFQGQTMGDIGYPAEIGGPYGRSAVTATETTGLGGPSPKMDKRKWTPQNAPVPEADDPNGRWPTHKEDVTNTERSKNNDQRHSEPLKEIGEQVTERQNVLEKSGPSHAPNTDTWDGSTTAVSSVQSNPIRDIMVNDYDGFVPEAVIQSAILRHRS